jgi:hypothetical protein
LTVAAPSWPGAVEPGNQRVIAQVRRSEAGLRQAHPDQIRQRALGARERAHGLPAAARERAPQQRKQQMEMGEEGDGEDHGRECGATCKPVG